MTERHHPGDCLPLHRYPDTSLYTPYYSVANVAHCAEQIGTDYVLSWRPNPTDMVCGSFDEDRIRRIIRAGMEASKGCVVTLNLKDVETVQGEADRLRRWVEITRSITDEYAA